MQPALDAQLVTALAGVELLAAVLLVWRSPAASPGGLLALQGGALAGIVVLLAVSGDGSIELLAVALLVFVLKAVVLPRVVARRPDDGNGRGRARGRLGPTTSLLAVAALAVMGYLVSRPLTSLVAGAAGRALPAGIALVLIGFFVLVAGTRARAQLVGFLLLDNGIATVAFLATGGVPVVVELGVSLDVLLVVLVLQVLGGRMARAFGANDLDQLRELRD